MKLNINGEPTECEAYSLAYGNDLLDGILINLPEHYILLSDHVESHRDYMEDEEFEEVEHFDLTDCEVDFEQPPHSWVLLSVGRMIVRTAEGVCIEACE